MPSQRAHFYDDRDAAAAEATIDAVLLERSSGGVCEAAGLGFPKLEKRARRSCDGDGRRVCGSCGSSHRHCPVTDREAHRQRNSLTHIDTRAASAQQQTQIAIVPTRGPQTPSHGR